MKTNTTWETIKILEEQGHYKAASDYRDSTFFDIDKRSITVYTDDDLLVLKDSNTKKTILIVNICDITRALNSINKDR